MKISTFEKINPETSAMLQAFYSRSHMSIEDRLKLLDFELENNDESIKKIFEKYYVNYGHKSIGDCGFITLYIEGVSLLAAKAIQDFRLYNGQESSTRYIDFQSAQFFHSSNDELGIEIYDHWLSFYIKSFYPLLAYFKDAYFKDYGNDVYFEKTLRSKTFDILRGFLPCGIKTQLSWVVNFRQLSDQLMRLESSPLPEVKVIASEIKKLVLEKYPHAFTHRYDADNFNYRRMFNESHACFEHNLVEDFKYCSSINFDEVKKEYFFLENRPKGVELPTYFDRFGQFMFNFKLDFGGFRDLQRHRNGTCIMPQLNLKNVFSSWYLQQLPEQLQRVATQLLLDQSKRLRELSITSDIDNNTLQYYFPLGWLVDVEYIATLPQIVYIAELRSSQTVHPTLRVIAQKMAKAVQNELPGIKLYVDYEDSKLCLKRGTQDIFERNNHAAE